MNRFKISQFWEDKNSNVYKEFDKLSIDTKARTISRLEVFERKTLDELKYSKVLEKVKSKPYKLFELKLKISPPVRFLGIIENNFFTPVLIIVKKTQKLLNNDIQKAIKRISYLK